MPLLAFNLTGTALALAAGKPVPPILPASTSPPARGPAYDVTSELRPNLTVDPAHGKAGGLTGANYVAIQVQVTAVSIALEWTGDPEYLTTGLTVPGPSPGAHAATHKTAGGTDLLTIAGTTAANSSAATGITGTGAGSSHAHGVTDGGHDHGAATGAGSSHTHSVSGDTPGTDSITAVNQSTATAQLVDLGAPDLADVDVIHAAILATDAGSPYNADAQPDVPRNLTCDFAATWDGGKITITGVDQFDVAVSEEFPVPGLPGQTVGVKIFKTINALGIAKETVGSNAVAVTIGIGNKLGITPGLAIAKGILTVEDAQEAAIGWDAIYSAVEPTTPPDGSKEFLVMVKTNHLHVQNSHAHTVASHNHGAATGAEAAHTHSVSSDTADVTVNAEAAHTHSITDPNHNHSQSSHAHNIT